MRPPEKVNTLWYMGPAASLMHAKFVVSDVHEGYLGTANLTSLGLGHHIEVGMELSPAHCKELIKMLSKLVEVGLFSETPPS
jgi:phosphatidylserine/phosphatidylglycerophosphate/cardiolipin synthase-like enzyme